MKDSDKVTLTFGQLQKLITEGLDNKETKILYFDDQIRFENWAKKYGINKSNGAEIYFDNVYCVDATKESQPTIKGVKCDGTMTWGGALRMLQKYFKVSDNGGSSSGGNDGYIWQINELYQRPDRRGVGGKSSWSDFVEDSEDIFDTIKDAFEDGLEALENFSDRGNYEMVVVRPNTPAPVDNYKDILKRATKYNGKISVANQTYQRPPKVEESFDDDDDFMDDDDYEETIRYDDIFDLLEGIDNAQLEQIINDDAEVERIADQLPEHLNNAWNIDDLVEAIRDAAEYILSGLSVEKMRAKMGRNAIVG